jgi:hypothetical protein
LSLINSFVVKSFLQKLILSLRPANTGIYVYIHIQYEIVMLTVSYMLVGITCNVVKLAQVGLRYTNTNTNTKRLLSLGTKLGDNSDMV